MKISIDTKHDSKDDIQRAIKLLSDLINTDVDNSQITESDSAGMFNLFGDNPTDSSEINDSNNSDDLDNSNNLDDTSIIDLDKNDEDTSNEHIDIIPY